MNITFRTTITNASFVGQLAAIRRDFLTPQALVVLSHIERAGSITQREAILDHSIQSLTRRITELRDKGFQIIREHKHHPITGQRYARYSLDSASFTV